MTVVKTMNEDRLSQPDLPFPKGLHGESSSAGVPREIEPVLPSGFHWVPGNGPVPGQPFVIWATASHPDDPDEAVSAVQSLFDAYRKVRET